MAIKTTSGWRGCLRNTALKERFTFLPGIMSSREDLLTSQEIKNMSRDFEIGAHTLTHPRLPMISAAQAEEEIFDSKALLEEITGKEVKTFCYPYGYYAKEHVQLVKNAGYRYARTVARYKFGLDNPSRQGLQCTPITTGGST